jgi:hypothetical protein
VPAGRSDGDDAFVQAMLCVWALARRSRITTMATSDALVLFSFNPGTCC